MEVVGVLNNVLDALKEAYKNKRRDVSVSLLAKCLRATWFRMQSGRDIVTNAVLCGSERHHWAERHLPAELEKHGFNCMREVRVEHAGVSGYVDLLCEKGGTHYAIVLKFTSTPYIWNPFIKWYRKQLRYYAAVADAIGVLILMDFNLEQSYKELVVLSPHERERLLKELKERHEVIKSGIKPPPERGPWCRFCAFKAQCFSRELP
jgi:CRISPR/Cas system-associated exonuclease Cas4 (RecB family)